MNPRVTRTHSPGIRSKSRNGTITRSGCNKLWPRHPWLSRRLMDPAVMKMMLLDCRIAWAALFLPFPTALWRCCQTQSRSRSSQEQQHHHHHHHHHHVLPRNQKELLVIPGIGAQHRGAHNAYSSVAASASRFEGRGTHQMLLLRLGCCMWSAASVLISLCSFVRIS